MDPLFSITLDEEWKVSVTIGWQIFLAVAAFWIVFTVFRRLGGGWFTRDVVVEGGDIGIGPGKIKLRRDDTDRQIAYKMWVELNTRKIGLPIDFENDVIVEIYDSWYNFFGIARELLKEIPISKIKRKHTQVITNLSIDVLNLGIRPHLTTWQAKFRRWYTSAEKAAPDETPQEIQKQYPHYDDLIADMKLVNERLIVYRDKLRELVMN